MLTTQPPARFRGLRIIDADTHLTEPADLWTSRAPAALRDRVPRVETVKGRPTWVVDGVTLSGAGGASVVGRDGKKVAGTEFFGWSFEQIHRGAYLIPERLVSMDEQGIWGQIVYPNTFGFGGQGFAKVPDPQLRIECARIFNDAMAEIQDESGGRIMPMSILPWWDLDAAIAEAIRANELGLHGINTTNAPHLHGLPDLGTPHWDPLWEVCADLEMPVNFHIGAATSDFEWFGTVSWPSLSFDRKLALGSCMLFLNNAAVLANLVLSGVLERHPTLRVVSVESGVGWIPFFLEALDYQVGEMPPSAVAELSMTPSAYFKRQIYSCFWFERAGITRAVAALGHDHLLFETDFPHPTCTYPNGLEIAAEALAELDDAKVADIMGGNAARVYNIDQAQPA